MTVTPVLVNGVKNLKSASPSPPKIYIYHRHHHYLSVSTDSFDSLLASVTIGQCSW